MTIRYAKYLEEILAQGKQNSVNVTFFIVIPSITFLDFISSIILEFPSGQWGCLAHLVPSIHSEVLLKYLMNQGAGESEPRYLFSFPSYLRVTNGNLVLLTFTSAEEIFFFFSIEAVKLNLYLLGSLPRRRHKRVLHPIYEGTVKVKAPQRSRGHGATVAGAVNNRGGALPSHAVHHPKAQAPTPTRKTECVRVLL